MKVAVIGSRSFEDYKVLEDFLDKMPYPIEHIVSGGAIGADSLAQTYAKNRGLPITIYYPAYAKFGNSAPFVRNEEIIKNCDFVCAFWDGESKGTLHSIKLAQKYNKDVVYGIEEELFN